MNGILVKAIIFGALSTLAGCSTTNRFCGKPATELVAEEKKPQGVVLFKGFASNGIFAIPSEGLTLHSAATRAGVPATITDDGPEKTFLAIHKNGQTTIVLLSMVHGTALGSLKMANGDLLELISKKDALKRGYYSEDVVPEGRQSIEDALNDLPSQSDANTVLQYQKTVDGNPATFLFPNTKALNGDHRKLVSYITTRFALGNNVKPVFLQVDETQLFRVEMLNQLLLATPARRIKQKNQDPVQYPRLCEVFDDCEFPRLAR